MKRITSLVFILAYLCPTSFGQALNVAKLDSFCSALSNLDMAMGSLTVSKNGVVQYQRAMGYSVMEGDSKIPARIDTKYRIGSVSKTFTAVMIFQLIQEGKISLNQKLGIHYPQLPNANKITIGHLLSHTSGLHDYTKDTNFPDWMDKSKTHDDMLQVIMDKGTDFEPGAKADYSSTNYLLLGYIIENLCKMSYADALQKRISARIGLHDTYYGGTIGDSKNESTSYKYADNGWKKEKQTNLGIHGGAGSIVSTTGDLVKFMNALFAHKLVSKTSLATMKTMVNGYGMGLFPDKYGSKPSFGHNGRVEEFYSALWYFPGEKLTIAYCTNGILFPRTDIVEGILKICFNEKFQMPFSRSMDIKNNDLDKYVGTYSSNQVPLKVVCTRLNTQLLLETNGKTFEVKPVGENYFMHAETGYFFEFFPGAGELQVKETDNVYFFTRKIN